MFDELNRQFVQKGCIRWRIGIAEIVHGINDAASQQVTPDAIRQSPREERITGL